MDLGMGRLGRDELRELLPSVGELLLDHGRIRWLLRLFASPLESIAQRGEVAVHGRLFSPSCLQSERMGFNGLLDLIALHRELGPLRIEGLDGAAPASGDLVAQLL